MKSQDLVIIIKIICLNQTAQHAAVTDGEANEWFSVRGLAASTGVSKSEVSNSLRRSAEVGLITTDRKTSLPKVNRTALFNFVLHGIKLVFPAKPSALGRGIPTAFSAPMLKSELRAGGDIAYIWPFAKGQEKGQTIEPLFRTVPEAAMKDERLYEYLALVDAIRIGLPREANLAAKILKRRLFEDA